VLQVKELRAKCEALAAKKRFLTHQAQESEKTAEAAAERRAAAGKQRAAGTLEGADTAGVAPAGDGASGSGGGGGEIQPASPQRPTSTATNTAAAGEAAGVGGAEGGEDDEDERLDCAICRSQLSEEIQVFPCGHYFCAECAAQTLLQVSPSCPFCRQKCTDKNTFRVAMAPSGRAHDAEVDPLEGPEVRKMQVRRATGFCSDLRWRDDPQILH
jgi:hypothetical protein